MLGTGCDRRRKNIVANTLTDKSIFRNVLRGFRESLHLDADNLQQILSEVVSVHLEGIRGTLDLVREENVAEESERDPGFRNRVAVELERARTLMRGS